MEITNINRGAPNAPKRKSGFGNRISDGNINDFNDLGEMLPMFPVLPSKNNESVTGPTLPSKSILEVLAPNYIIKSNIINISVNKDLQDHVSDRYPGVAGKHGNFANLTKNRGSVGRFGSMHGKCLNVKSFERDKVLPNLAIGLGVLGAECPELNSLPLLPDDRRFIKQRLRGVPNVHKRQVLVTYCRRFLAAMEAEPRSHHKGNAGRYQANSWLRRITDGFQEKEERYGQ